jgi:6,7-dimethyl-8-ribityllumazine synthase
MSTQNPVRLAAVVSEFNPAVTSGLLNGARRYLEEQGIDLPTEAVFSAPGAYEIPLIARAVASTGAYNGIICLGCVVKGDTAHFEYISLAATLGLMMTSLNLGIPLSFGILTTYTDEQAEARSADNAHNKGREAAAACVKSIHVLERLRGSGDADPQKSRHGAI